jgi:hypothetical protein
MGSQPIKRCPQCTCRLCPVCNGPMDSIRTSACSRKCQLKLPFRPKEVKVVGNSNRSRGAKAARANRKAKEE